MLRMRPGLGGDVKKNATQAQARPSAYEPPHWTIRELILDGKVQWAASEDPPNNVL